ncbi:Cof-type HAD-IIB family hydrolase [Lacticaseibacillus hulanensis]|uniref:Cof-type HAD-IIB family hydrolase n=1 Tax=Lacticaseibacillus hulanensis TaxID=2493111 RepID=UPI000FD8C57D|nr:Cof-type HAD-IIB family hydrolase [Lacticaseibacillus hulanensis]
MADAPKFSAVVFFDLDGTLLRDDKSVAKTTVDALDKLRQNNVLPVIATGRNVFEVQYVLDQTGINTIVSANGSYVASRGQEIYAATIPEDLIKAVNRFANEHANPVGWYNNQGFAISKKSQDTVDNYHLLNLNAQVDPNFYKQNEVNFMFVFNRHHEQAYAKKFAGQLSFVRNNIRGLDTMLAGVSKKTGIEHLLRALNLTNAPSYAFGDQLNDLQMFSLVDHPIAMGNGVAVAKTQAEYVTSSNMHDGIVRGLEHYKLV